MSRHGEQSQSRTIRSYRDLRVWSESIQLVKSIYSLSSRFPDEERFGLTSQIRRSAISVPSNIAEGKMRSHRKEYLHFLSIAQGSLAEVDTQIEIAYQLGYISQGCTNQITQALEAVAKQLHALRRALRRSAPKPKT